MQVSLNSRNTPVSSAPKSPFQSPRPANSGDLVMPSVARVCLSQGLHSTVFSARRDLSSVRRSEAAFVDTGMKKSGALRCLQGAAHMAGGIFTVSFTLYGSWKLGVVTACVQFVVTSAIGVFARMARDSEDQNLLTTKSAALSEKSSLSPSLEIK